MNIIIAIFYGVLGSIIGYKIPFASLKIIEFKNRKDDVRENSFLNSKILIVCLCLFNGLAWASAGYIIENDLVALIIGIQITLGLIITYIDIKTRIIPNELVLTLIILGIIFQIINFGPKALIGSLISMIVMMFVFISIAGFVGFGKVGAGDVKLAGAMGVALGYPLIITSVGVMAVVLLIFILIGMALKKIYLSTMLPMAPFMISGYVIGLLSLLI
ncbi:MAG: peptidase prepilin type [Haloplasmataceae bacterium]|nr:peptidase prepilin type [Haloplasmataceae bacterium]